MNKKTEIILNSLLRCSPCIILRINYCQNIAMILIMLSNVEANEKHCKKFYCKIMYRGAQKKVYEYCFTKQKCQIQMGIAQYKNAATPMRTRDINTTHQHF